MYVLIRVYENWANYVTDTYVDIIAASEDKNKLIRHCKTQCNEKEYEDHDSRQYYDIVEVDWI